MKIIFFQRKPFQDFVSIEHIYEMIRSKLPENVKVKVHISKYHSKGILKRIYNICEAAFHQGDVNHVTGDVNFLVFLLSRNKTILSVHATFNPNPSKFAHFIINIIWWYLPLKRAKYITVVSNSLKEEVVRKFNCDSDKIKLIYNPVNPIFQPLPKKFSEKPILLQIGTKPKKNVERLFEALEGINCQLNIIGTLSKNQKRLLTKYGIDYINSAELTPIQMNDVYKECDILTFVSIYEGFGMPIVEANAVGRVVITGNSTSIPEVAQDAALMVDPYDVNAIRRGILKLIHDENYRNQLIQNGFENAKRFDINVITKQYFELYKMIYESA